MPKKLSEQITQGDWGWKDDLNLVVGLGDQPQNRPICNVMNRGEESFHNANAISLVPKLLAALENIHEILQPSAMTAQAQFAFEHVPACEEYRTYLCSLMVKSRMEVERAFEKSGAELE